MAKRDTHEHKIEKIAEKGILATLYTKQTKNNVTWPEVTNKMQIRKRRTMMV